mgnify:CR=1 FL=1
MVDSGRIERGASGPLAEFIGKTESSELGSASGQLATRCTRQFPEAVGVELGSVGAVVISVQRQMKCAEEDGYLNREWTRIHTNSGSDSV